MTGHEPEPDGYGKEQQEHQSLLNIQFGVEVEDVARIRSQQHVDDKAIDMESVDLIDLDIDEGYR